MANAVVTVLEADGTTETDVTVLDVGRQAAAASKSVAASTEDKAVLDAIAASLSVIDDWDSSDQCKVILQAGSAAIGKLAANSGVDIGDVDVTSVPTDPFGANADAASATGSISAKLRFIANTGIPITGTVTVGSHAVTNAGTFAVQDSQWYTEDAAAASDPKGPALLAVRRDTLSTSEVSADGDNIALKATNKGKLHVAAELRFADTVADTGSGTGGSATQRVIVDSSQLGALGQAAMASSQAVVVASNQTWPTGMSPRAFTATFTTLTRPANTTAYAAADSISDNATAGSVTALSASVSDTNDDPITITEILVSSTDTGLAGKKLRAYLFNSNPTSNSGVGGGDNAAYSQKVAGYIGSFMGYMETGFSDGTVGRLVPTFNETNYTPAGGFVVAVPTSGAKTLYIQYQAVEAFTPSANSTTIIGKAKGYQGRAA